MALKPVGPRIRSQEINDNFAYVNQQILSKSNASPKGVFATLADLQNAYPNGSDGVYLVQSNGYIYSWNGTSWDAVVQYQSTGIADHSVDEINLTESVAERLVSNIDNLITNGDFSDEATGWQTTSASISVVSNEGQMTASAGSGRVYYGLTYADTDIIYRSALVKANSPQVAIGAGTNRWAFHSGSGAYERLSDSRAWAANKFLTIIDGRTVGFDAVYIKNAVAINLTATFGAGNEPTKEEMDALLDEYGGFIKNKVDIWDYSRKSRQGSMLIKLENLARDGDFTGSGIAWAVQFATLSKTGNELTMTANGGSNLPRAIHNTGHSVIAGNKIYASVVVEANADCNLIFSESYVGGVSSGEYMRVTDPQADIVHRLSGIITASSSGVLDIRVLHRYVDAATANGKSIKIRKLVLIDLTATFGAGNEPSKADMDALIKSKGYFIQSDTIANPGRVAATVTHVNKTYDGYYNPPLKDAYNGTSVFRLNAETMTTDTLYKLWDSLIATHPTLMSKSILGKDASDTLDILRVNFTPPNAKHKILLQANIHGNSDDGDPQDAGIALYEFIRDIVLNFQGDPVLTYLRYNVAFDIIPCANPWGYNNNQRTNSNEVDLNRDFVTPTPQAETVIIKSWLEANKDADLFMDIHGYGRGQTNYRLVGYKNNLNTLENSVLEEVGEYLRAKRGYTFLMNTSSNSMAIYYAKYTLGIPSLLPEFPVYAAGRVTHGAEMTTQYTEWIGNLVYRLAIQQNVTIDRLMMRSADGSKRYLITLDNNGDFVKTEI